MVMFVPSVPFLLPNPNSPSRPPTKSQRAAGEGSLQINTEGGGYGQGPYDSPPQGPYDLPPPGPYDCPPPGP